MIRALHRWIRLALATAGALLVFLGRELHPIVIGGYTRHDDRHPDQVARRIAAREHELFPLEKHGHSPKVCDDCDPDKLYERSRMIPAPTTEAWVCVNCGKTGYGPSTWRAHWRDTFHTDYEAHADRYKAHAVGKKIRAELELLDTTGGTA